MKKCCAWIISFFVFWSNAEAQAQTLPIPSLRFGVEAARSPQEVALSLQILFLLTVLALAPAIFIMVTSFTRVVVVLAFLRQGLGTQQVPPNQVLISLALFLTFFIMQPTFSRVWQEGLSPYLAGQLTAREAFQNGEKPIRQFMLKQTREKDLALFVSLSRSPRPRTPDDLPLWVIVPAFMISELRKAFEMGFILFLPFLIIDMVVASVLMSMGMLMLPPVLISLPFKILLFVLVDGWNLVVRTMIQSFHL